MNEETESLNHGSVSNIPFQVSYFSNLQQSKKDHNFRFRFTSIDDLVHVFDVDDQVLSWNPRVFYLPNFATKQQCEAVIDMAKPKLKPSLLALRKGETAETTQNVRTRLKKTYKRLHSP